MCSNNEFKTAISSPHTPSCLLPISSLRRNVSVFHFSSNVGDNGNWVGTNCNSAGGLPNLVTNPTQWGVLTCYNNKLLCCYTENSRNCKCDTNILCLVLCSGFINYVHAYQHNKYNVI